MPNTPFTNPSGAFWPLGKIVVTTAGTPVAININVGPQSQGQGANPNQFSRRIHQISVYPLATNTKGVYVVWNGYDHATNTNGVLLYAPAGSPQSLPSGALLQTALITIDNLFLDADVSGEGAYATAIWG